MVSSHHQQHLLSLMGIEPWVERHTPTQTFHYSIWRDDEHQANVPALMEVKHLQPLSPLSAITKVNAKNNVDDTSIHRQQNEAQNNNIQQNIQQNIHQNIQQSETVLAHLPKANHLAFKQKTQQTASQTQHHLATANDIDEITYHANEQITSKRCLAICQSESFVLMTQFDDDIQQAQIAQRDDVKLWRNIQQFVKTSHQRYVKNSTAQEMQSRVVVWQYDFINLEDDGLPYFQQGYLDAMAQQKQILVLGDVSITQATWQKLPSLSEMLHSVDAKRQCYHTLINLFAQL